MQLARAPNRKRLSGNAEGVGRPRLGFTGACSSITPSFSSTSHFSSCTYLALCPNAFLLHSLLPCEADTLHLCLVTSSPFVPSLASPDPPPLSSVPSPLILCNFICPWHGPRGRTVRDPWCYPRHCRNPSGHKHPADVHIWFCHSLVV